MAADWLRRRTWAVSLSAASIILGMAFSFWWAVLVRHSHVHYWVIPADLWLTVRDAHLVTWGALPYLYGSKTALVTLPGLPILLAPVAGIVQLTNLTESFGPWNVAHPDSWLVYGPVVLAMGASVIFVADAWARALGVGGWRRRLSVLAAASVAWNMTAVWGHPEDALGLAVALWCLLALKEERWVRAGWCLGLALCFQPLVILLLPVLIIQAGRQRVFSLLLRGAILPGGLLAAAMAVDARDVLHAVLEQPNFPLIDQPTPWSLLSPRLAAHTIGAGPSRLIAVAVAWALGGLGWRWRDQWAKLLWLGSAMLATRGVFEPVMVPYYVDPALFLAVIVAWTALPAWRALMVTAGGFATIMICTSRGPMWSWWLEASGTLVVTILASSPPFGARRAEQFRTVEAPDVEPPIGDPAAVQASASVQDPDALGPPPGDGPKVGAGTAMTGAARS